MNVLTKMYKTQSPTTLRDLVKPKLGRSASTAVKRALKSAKKDQDAIKRSARK